MSQTRETQREQKRVTKINHRTPKSERRSNRRKAGTHEAIQRRKDRQRTKNGSERTTRDEEHDPKK